MCTMEHDVPPETLACFPREIPIALVGLKLGLGAQSNALQSIVIVRIVRILPAFLKGCTISFRSEQCVKRFFPRRTQIKLTLL